MRNGLNPGIQKKSQTREIFHVWQLILKVITQTVLRRFDNFSALNAAGANFHSTVTARRKLHTDALQIRVKPTTSFIVSV